MKPLSIVIGILLVVVGVIALLGEQIPSLRGKLEEFQNNANLSTGFKENNSVIRLVPEESVVIDVVKKASPSVITIAAEVPNQREDLFSIFGLPEAEEDEGPQNIGSGFVLSEDGLIVTNKHVVSDVEATYSVLTKDDVRYKITQIYRDPLNDVAILKIDPSEHDGVGLEPATLGDSSKLQVGQLAIAIGTPLGEFSNSVTKGIVSGLGRGLVAGSPFEGSVERLDDVIQTDAAINPGNSGGPLLDSSARVIGVNTAVSRSGENLGFAIPINIVKEVVKTFEETGRFDRAFLGVSYRIVPRDLALSNQVPEGALVLDVVSSSPAENAGIEQGDIITHIGNTRITEREEDVAKIISTKKVGDALSVKIWREENGEGKEITLNITLGNATEQ